MLDNKSYPCKCGETHDGDYGIYTFMQHNCDHKAERWVITDDMPDYVMCSDCGETDFKEDYPDGEV